MESVEEKVESSHDGLAPNETIKDYRVVKTSDVPRARRISHNGTRYVVVNIPESQYSRIFEIVRT